MEHNTRAVNNIFQTIIIRQHNGHVGTGVISKKALVLTTKRFLPILLQAINKYGQGLF